MDANRPKIVFFAINLLEVDLFSAGPALYISIESCEHFLNFFTDKIENIRASISLPGSGFVEVHPSTCHYHKQFQPITSSQLSEVVSHVNPSYWPLDIFPVQCLKEAFSAILLNAFTENTESALVRVCNDILLNSVHMQFSPTRTQCDFQHNWIWHPHKKPSGWNWS